MPTLNCILFYAVPNQRSSVGSECIQVARIHWMTADDPANLTADDYSIHLRDEENKLLSASI